MALTVLSVAVQKKLERRLQKTGRAAWLCNYRGTRRSEAFNMTWGDIDFDNHTIRFPKHKTMNYDWEPGGQVRVMTGKARELLLEPKEQAGSISPTQKVF